MGFSSHSSDLLNREKLYAKSIKRRGSYFVRKQKFLEASSKEGLNIKSATPDQMRRINAKIKGENSSEHKKKILVLIVSLFSGILLLLIIGRLIQYVFF